MKGVRGWLPLPFWLVILMFVAGVGAGVGLALMVTQSGPPSISATSPWKDEHTGTLPPYPPPAPPLETEEPGEPGEQAVAPGTTGEADGAAPPPPTDERRLTNLPGSPVRRALESALDRLEMLFAPCRAEIDGLSDPLEVRVSFESLGGMATVTGVVFYHPQAVALQDCLLKKVGQALIAFPVEDGSYEVIHRFAAP